ncbi:MAG: magnesium transporter CorA [Betaproteobacteria bacterium]|nr:magnesium transporter CorA [Betaproteobacteria bacterium]
MNLNDSYGPDAAGLICGYVFAPGERGRKVNAADAQAWLKTPTTDGSFVWLHFNIAHAACEKWLAQNLGLTDAFYETLREESRSTRIEYADDALIAVVNDVLFDFSLDAPDIATMWVSADTRMLVSVRTKPLRSIDQLRASVNNGETFRSTADLLVRLLRDQADVLVRIMREATQKTDVAEDSLLAGRLETKRANLGTLRRVLVRLQRLLAPEPAALFRLLNHPPVWMATQDVQELRESTEEFSTALNDMAGLLERIKLLQEEIAAMVNEQNNRSLFVLTIVTVLALPINIIAGLLGMNVGGIPLAKEDNGFWIIVGIVATFTVIAVWITFKRRRD